VTTPKRTLTPEEIEERRKQAKLERSARLTNLRSDVRQVVPNLARDHGVSKEIGKGVSLFFERSDEWWIRRHEFTCWQWMAEACKAVGLKEKAKYFKERHENREDDLERFIPYLEVIRKWRGGKLVITDGLDLTLKTFEDKGKA
jgi:hypothetical protein